MAAVATGATATTTSKAPKPRVLVVDDEPAMVELMGDVVGRQIDCRVISAGSLREARQVLDSEPIELLVADMRLPDGDGMSLVSALGRCQPQASAMVITGSATVENAVQALRCGAVDFLAKPFSADHLLDRVRLALRRQSMVARHEKRLTRLRSAVKRLNEARKVVSKKVDLLCNDLISAYGELSRQFDCVRTQEGFRKYITQSNDLEQMLCHAMDWLLRQIGYSNVAIWLAAEDQKFQLGAYMKYTVAGSEALADVMGRGIVRQVISRGSLHLNAEQAQEILLPEEVMYLSGQDLLAVHCTYLGETLAAIVMFRGKDAPFTEDHLAALQAISPIFAVSLASAVRPAGGDESDGDEEGKDGPAGYDDGYPKDDRKGRRDADWWKRGEQPPF